ncbi:hypothetical protein [Teredinibacter turnerae]|nr:hypothetical protein [Teredinibacter turnerae]
MDELFKLIAAGGDMATWAVVYVYVKHSGMLARIQAKIEYIERYIESRAL